MGNMFDYLEKYGNVSFDEKKVTDIDILLFAQISYACFSNIVLDDTIGMRLADAWESAKEKNSVIRGIAHKNAVKMLNKMSNCIRYQNLILKNYEYLLTDETQFGAITIVVPNDHIYISFEGTDDTITGWKEDFKLTYTYPTEAQKLATQYVNKVVRFSAPDVIICGHSKGGNLALVSAMNMNFFRRSKVKKIYSFDGPGLKMKEFKSLSYRLVKNKLINIIPNLSLVGVLLEQENVKVIKSKGIGLFQHDPSTWIINDDKFQTATQDKLSKRLDESINKWLNKHNFEEREKIIEGVFSIFENSGIKSIYDIKENKLKSISILTKTSMDMSKETRMVILNSLRLLANDFGTDVINDGKKLVSSTIEKHFKRKG